MLISANCHVDIQYTRVSLASYYRLSDTRECTWSETNLRSPKTVDPKPFLGLLEIDGEYIP